MPFDAMPEGEPWRPWCRSCKQTIHSDEQIRELTFEGAHAEDLQEMSGSYHEACAQPYASMARVLRMMSRRF